MTEYARYLGIDPAVDHDLLWIAEEALEAPLPSEWTEHFDSSDRVDYYNETTKGTSLTHPLENLYRDAYKTIVHFRGAMSPQDRVDELLKLQQECQQMEREVQDECTAWEEHERPDGEGLYYYNPNESEENQISYTDPVARRAKRHILYLKMMTIQILWQSPGIIRQYPHPGHKTWEGRVKVPEITS